jgi:hypothetical protein
MCVGFVLLLGACSITQSVESVESYKIDAVCIERNNSVFMEGFLPELVSQIEKQGVRTQIYNGNLPDDCRYKLSYVANWTWDLAMYLSYANISIFDDSKLIGQATYDARQGGANMGKFGATAEKLQPLINELFSGKGGGSTL